MHCKQQNYIKLATNYLSVKQQLLLVDVSCALLQRQLAVA